MINVPRIRADMPGPAGGLTVVRGRGVGAERARKQQTQTRNSLAWQLRTLLSADDEKHARSIGSAASTLSGRCYRWSLSDYRGRTQPLPRSRLRGLGHRRWIDTVLE